MAEPIETDIREHVRERYAGHAKLATDVAPAAARQAEEACCGTTGQSSQWGDVLYDAESREGATEAAVAASLGCGVPTAVADLHEGETVLDLGSGAGADVLISARRVGPTGKAIGLDMTDEMLELARRNAAEAGATNVEFLKGYIEEIPLPDRLGRRRHLQLRHQPLRRQAPRDPRGRARAAPRRALRRLRRDRRPRHGRRHAQDMQQWTGCIAGALTRVEFAIALHNAGLDDVEITETHRVHEHAGAAIIRARKP